MAIHPIFETTITNHDAARTEIASSHFVDKLLSERNYFHPQESHLDAQKILLFFEKLNLPAPENKDEFVIGTAGDIVFSNTLGLVIRIESKYPKNGSRINNNGYILKPIASIETDLSIIEVCPAVKLVERLIDVYALKSTLEKTSVDYDDSDLENTGIVPIHTLNFPNGNIVVTDRLAVSNLDPKDCRIKNRLEIEAERAQDKLYSPLRKAFKKAWANERNIPNFITLCQKFKEQRKLVTGWNDFTVNDRKTKRAVTAAKQYDRKLALPLAA